MNNKRGDKHNNRDEMREVEVQQESLHDKRGSMTNEEATCTTGDTQPREEAQ